MSIICPCCHNINVVFAEMFPVSPSPRWWMIRTKEPQPIDKCPYCRTELTNAQSEMPRPTESNDTADEGDTSGVPPSDVVQTDGG